MIEDQQIGLKINGIEKVIEYRYIRYKCEIFRLAGT